MSTKDVQRDLHHGMQRPPGFLSHPKEGMENSEKNFGVSMGKSSVNLRFSIARLAWLLHVITNFGDIA